MYGVRSSRPCPGDTSQATAPQLLFLRPLAHAPKKNAAGLPYAAYTVAAELGCSCTCGLGLLGGSSFWVWLQGVPVSACVPSKHDEQQ
jgi:hypothetical protein